MTEPSDSDSIGDIGDSSYTSSSEYEYDSESESEDGDGEQNDQLRAKSKAVTVAEAINECPPVAVYDEDDGVPSYLQEEEKVPY